MPQLQNVDSVMGKINHHVYVLSGASACQNATPDTEQHREASQGNRTERNTL